MIVPRGTEGNGNPTTYKSTTHSFDVENRLAQYGTAPYAGYNGDGLRAWKDTDNNASNGRTYFINDGTNLVCELNASGSVTATNTWGANGLVSRHTSAGSVFYVYDPQGSVAQRLDDSGGVVSSDLYDAYGNKLTGNPNSDPYGYNGQWGYYTDETGLVLCTHRYYDPANGRWVTRDPIGYEGGLNLYGYVKDNPVVWTDPSGELIGSFVAGLVIGYAAGAVKSCISDALRKAEELHAVNDKLAHCYMACRTALCLGGGICQSYLVPGFMSRGEDDPNDIEANKRGGSCARDQWRWPFNRYRDCYSCCKAKIRGLPNQPGPLR